MDTAQDVVIPASPHSAEEDVTYLFEFLSARQYTAFRIRTEGRLTEYLPNTEGRYVDADTTEIPLHPGAAVIVGEITSVTPSHALIEGTGDSPEQGRRYVAFNDPDACCRGWILTVRVQEAFGEVAGATTLTAGITTWGGVEDAARFAHALDNLGPAVFVMEPDRPGLFPGHDDVWLISGNGILIAPLGEDGTLSWPMLRCTELTTMLEGAATLDELRARAAEPVRHVEIEHYGESWRPVSERPVEPPPETGPPGPPIAVGDRPEC